MRYKTNFVMAIILDYPDSAFLYSAIICCTTIDALSILSEGKLFTFGSPTDWLTDLFPVTIHFSKSHVDQTCY
jgi:hypothetical protein